MKKKCETYPILDALGTRCFTGHCKVTNTIGCELKCTYVFHTVGPRVKDVNQMKTYEGLLRDCYENCLQNVLLNKVQSIVFPCISTGIFKFPNDKAAQIALKTVRSWLERYHSEIEQIVFCTYLDKDFDIYLGIMPEYFPAVDEPITMPDITNMDNEPLVNSASLDSHIVAGTDNAGSSNSMDVHTNNFTVSINKPFPIRLENKNANVCFFNSLVQILYSLL